ncbi:MAG: radical SAM protein [Deltaproteobacteria bacterium]|nr:radical SAM protein [Deltaproteobacteria bacterium]
MNTAAPPPPGNVNLCVTMRCNLRCHMCACPEVRLKEPEIDRWLGFIDRLGAWLPKGHRVLLTGGEPMVHKHIDDFVSRLAAQGFAVTMATNGSLLTAERVARLEKAGLSHFNISLDGLAETNDSVRNGPGLFQGVLDIIHYITHRTGIEVRVVAVISDASAADMPELVRLLSEKRKIARIHFQSVIPTMARPWSYDFFERDALWPRDPSRVGRVQSVLGELAAMKDEGYPINNPASQFGLWRR